MLTSKEKDVKKKPKDDRYANYTMRNPDTYEWRNDPTRPIDPFWY